MESDFKSERGLSGAYIFRIPVTEKYIPEGRTVKAIMPEEWFRYTVHVSQIALL